MEITVRQGSALKPGACGCCDSAVSSSTKKRENKPVKKRTNNYTHLRSKVNAAKNKIADYIT